MAESFCLAFYNLINMFLAEVKKLCTKQLSCHWVNSLKCPLFLFTGKMNKGDLFVLHIYILTY